MLHPYLAPMTAIVAGVIVLIYPKILNYVVAIYLILSGILAIAAVS
jgi:ribosomal protein L11 methylase PrmA